MTRLLLGALLVSSVGLSDNLFPEPANDRIEQTIVGAVETALGVSGILVSRRTRDANVVQARREVQQARLSQNRARVAHMRARRMQTLQQLNSDREALATQLRRIENQAASARRGIRGHWTRLRGYINQVARARYIEEDIAIIDDLIRRGEYQTSVRGQRGAITLTQHSWRRAAERLTAKKANAIQVYKNAMGSAHWTSRWLRRVAFWGGVLLVADAAGRFIVWNALDASPGVSPLYTLAAFGFSQAAAGAQNLWDYLTPAQSFAPRPIPTLGPSQEELLEEYERN